uniref:Uncharacterized protein n=1 Tax=Aegilops tauschii TaxID=37682 RepID=N1R3S9_AEGTA
MAMPSTASCCFVSSSPHGRRRLTHTTTAWSPARIRLVSRSAPSPNPLRRSSSSSEPAPGVAGDEGEYVDREVEEDRDERYGFEMEVRKLPGKKNRRLVGEQDLALGFKFNAKGTIDCYEGEMELLPESGARRREIDFNMVDGDFKVFQGKWSVQEVLLESRARCREIAFNIVDGDFKVFEGNGLARSWSLSSGFQSGYWKEGSAKR